MPQVEHQYSFDILIYTFPLMYTYLQVINITISLKINLLFFSHNLQAWMLTYLFFCLFSGNIPTSALRATEVNLFISCEPRVNIIYHLFIKKSYVFKTLRWCIVLILKTQNILCFQSYKYYSKCCVADKWRIVVLIFCNKHTWMIPNSQINESKMFHNWCILLIHISSIRNIIILNVKLLQEDWL